MNDDRTALRLLVVCLLVAAVLRLAGLGRVELWGDEVLSTTAQYLPLTELIAETQQTQTLMAPVEPPGFHVLNRLAHLGYAESHLAIQAPGGRFLLRLLSALAGIVLVLAVAGFVRLVLPWREAWPAAALAAMSFYGVYYSRENRPYMLVALVSLLAAWFFWKAVVERRRIYAPAHGLSLALLGYLSYPAVLVPVIHLALATTLLLVGPVVPRPDGSRSRLDARDAVTLAIAGVIALAAFAPWLPHTWTMARQPALYHPELALADPGRFTDAWAVVVATLAHWGTGGMEGFLVLAPLVVIGLVAAWRTQRAFALVLTLHLLVPFGYILISRFGWSFHPRYVIFAYPFYLVAAGYGLAQAVRRAARAGTDADSGRWLARAVLVSVLLVFAVQNTAALRPYYHIGIKCSADNCPNERFCIRYLEGPGTPAPLSEQSRVCGAAYAYIDGSLVKTLR